MKLDELIDWINELEEYFEYKDIRDPDRVKFAKAKRTCQNLVARGSARKK